MQDIRRPSNRSKSNIRITPREDVTSRLEKFEKRIYKDDQEDVEANRPIRIKINNTYNESTERVRDIENRESIHEIRDGHSSFSTKIFIAFVALLIIGFLLLNFIFNSATINITPKYKDILFSKESSKVMIMNLDGLEGVKFQVASSSISKTRSLPKTDTKTIQTKASGKIVIYNNFDTNPQKLIKNTRFESSKGKIYRITESVTIPGMKGSTPGSIGATVYADSYGADYNIDASDFTLPGFKGTARYKGFYARSDGKLEGGVSGLKGLVNKSDLNAAKDEFAMSITKDIQDNLRKIKIDGYIPVYDQIQIVFSDNEKDLNIGTTADYTETGTGYLMLVNKDELANGIAGKTDIINKYNGEKMHILYDDTLHFTLRNTADLSKDFQLEVMVDGNPRLYFDIDENNLKQSVLGKTQTEFNEIIRTFNGVGQVTTNFFPFWLKTFSTKLGSVNVVQNLPLR